MKQTIIIHGRPDPDELEAGIVASESHWFPWLKQKIEATGELCMTPEFPFRDGEPHYSDWVSVLEKSHLDNETCLIGHSTGGGFILRYVTEHPELRLEKIVLVAPWIDPSKILLTDFFNFEIDQHLTGRMSVHVFISADDMDDVVDSVNIIKAKLPNAHYHEFIDREHFCTKEFPELLEIVL